MPHWNPSHQGWGRLRWVASASIAVLALNVALPWTVAQDPAATPKKDAPKETSEAAKTPEPKAYETLPVLDLKNSRRRVGQILGAGNLESGDQTLFDDYYRKYFLARWTLPENCNKLPSLRKELSNEFWKCRNKPVHAYLSSLVLDFMGKMAEANVHPAARYNAMLTIGNLNSREQTGRVNPVPLSEAFPLLLKLLTDEQQTDAVRIGALIGVARHAELGISDQGARGQALDAALKLATTRNVPGRSVRGHAWMRCRAIEILGSLGTAGADGSVAKALAQIVGQASNPMNVRCAAARAFGQIERTQETGLKPAEVAGHLGRLAIVACKTELDRMKKEIDKRRQEEESPGAGRFGGRRGFGHPMMDRGGLIGGPGRGFGTDEEEEEQLERVCRRRLKAWLVAVKQGLAGTEEKPGGVVSLAQSEADKKFLAAVSKPIDTWISLLDDKKLEDDKLVSALEDSLGTYENLLQATPKAAEPKKETRQEKET